MIHKIFFIFWKDLLMRKNHYIASILEILLPIGLIILANLSLPKQEHEVENDPIAFEALKDQQCLLRHSHYGNIIYEPSTAFTDTLMAKAACYAGYKKSNVKPGNLNDKNSYFSIGVKFDSLPSDSKRNPHILNYTLFPTNKAWVNLLTLWRFSGSAIPRFSIPNLYNLVEFQRAIDATYLHMKNISVEKLNLENTDLYERTPRIFSIAIYLSLFVAFSLMVPPIVSRIVQEKFTGSKELMIMMGIVRWELWVAKFMDVILFLLITFSGVVLFLYVPLKEDSNCLKISPFLFWSVIMYGLLGVIFFLFFMSCFFEKSTLAVYVTEIIWSFSFIFSNFISALVELPSFVKYLMCLFPHVSLMQGVSVLLDFDFYGKKVRFTEKLSGKEDSLSLLNILFMMSTNIILYAVLTWYLDQVKPGRYGIPQPYNFCFKKSYWIPRKVLTICKNTPPNKSHSNFESVPTNLQVGVSIQNVSKIYKSLDRGTVTAVDDVSVDFYHSEISALLGHNGAGKTTIFSMITGLSYPTSGKIIINGYDLRINGREARRSLGLCPQQDMLFNDLTVTQILKFYGVVKGLSLTQAKKEALNLIKKLKLNDVNNIQTSHLSGGQKRKVSLAIALIGGSEVLVLDEPTAGIDPEIRRDIWEILLGFRGERTILLTTHFMEEADALCDRIAIMDHGRIKCYGSPMFLKSKYGKGYVLNVVILDLDKSKELMDCIKQFIPLSKFKSQNIRTLSFELPESEVALFPALFTALEEKQSKGEITSYSISLATLEDVFLRLRSGDEPTDGFDTIDLPCYKKLDIVEDLSPVRTPNYLLYLFQFWALIFKKWIFFRRTYKSFLLYCVSAFIAILKIPTDCTQPTFQQKLQPVMFDLKLRRRVKLVKILSIVLVILTMALFDNKSHINQVIDLSSQKPLTYSLGLYTSSLVLYSHLNNTYKKELFENLVESFGSKAQEVSDIKDAVHKIFNDDFYTYTKKVVLAVDFLAQEVRVLHNENAVHMVPISLNFIHNFLLKYWYNNDTIMTTVNIKFANKELFVLPRSAPKCTIENLPDFSGSQTMFYLLGPIKERIYGAKGIQLMITTASLYWFSHLVFDVAWFFLYILIVYLGVGLSLNDAFILQHAGEILLGFLFWGSGLILLIYVISTLIKDVAAAFSVNIIIYVVYTFIVYNVISLEGLPKIFQYLHPTCILKFGFADLCAEKQSNFLWTLLLYNCVVFVFLVVKDSQLLSRIIHTLINGFLKVNYSVEEVKDDFVKEEEEIVKKLIKKENISNSALIVDELRRWYFKGFHASPAVRGISFAVNKGECFGLLGVNGAGKTSTFKMLTGALPTSQGNIYVCSEQLPFFNRQKYLFSIGYCPQFGGLIPAFKGKELLMFFARLRGMRRSDVGKEVQKWLEKMDLLEYENQKCGTYSGGNQRKLSTAVALIGDRPVVFLDEPTTGVDPLSRRSIWNAIGHIQKQGQSVVLTSHSMDECEALCTRLAIMVNGGFRCIGETTTLKDRFGQGYCIQIKLSSGAAEEAVHSLKKSIAEAFGSNCELIDEHLTLLQYHVIDKSTCWAELFMKLNFLKENYNTLESYTASATTLEQIFIYFARNQ